jgi:hypothetical protein
MRRGSTLTASNYPLPAVVISGKDDGLGLKYQNIIYYICKREIGKPRC